MSRSRRIYERLSGEATVVNPQVWNGSGKEQFLALTKKCKDAIQEANALMEKYADVSLEIMEEDIKSPIKQYQLGFGAISSPGEAKVLRMWELLKQYNMTFGPYYIYMAGGLETMAKLKGADVGYRLAHHPAKSDFIQSVEDGVLNPETGLVRKQKFNVYSTPENLAAFKKDVTWFLKKVSTYSGVENVVYLGERDFEWSLWGEWMHEKFLNYLKEKYSSIQELNQTWATEYADFTDITLPVAKPETRQDHGLWEDWTRYREVYHLTEEVMPLQELVQTITPDLRSNVYASYNRQPVHPANGINYHEVFKGFNPSTYEMGPPTEAKQILAADITSSGGRNLTSEWSGMYFPLGFAPDRTDLIKREMWNGVGWGQLGIQIYSGATRAGHYDGNLLDFHENPTANLAQFKIVADDFKRVSPLLMDGEREPALIQVIYSPTTRRHTSWPGVEADRPMEEVSGWWATGKVAHYHTRALDEGAALEKDFEGKMIVASDVEYMTDALEEKLTEHVKAGGVVVVSTNSARFNEYGAAKDSLLARIGAVPASTDGRIVEIGKKKLELPDYLESVTFNMLFEDRSEVVLRYNNGDPAIIKVQDEKGHWLVVGFTFGRGWKTWLNEPEDPAHFLNVLAHSVQIESGYKSEDPRLVVWPWKYNGRKFLILTYPVSSKLADAPPAKEGFPFRRPSSMIPVNLLVRGEVSAQDMVVGGVLPSEVQNGWTKLNTLIASPGGVILEILPRTNSVPAIQVA